MKQNVNNWKRSLSGKMHCGFLQGKMAHKKDIKITIRCMEKISCTLWIRCTAQLRRRYAALSVSSIFKGKKGKGTYNDIVPLRKSSSQQRSGIYGTRLEGSHSFTCTPTLSIPNRNEPYQLLPYSWYSFRPRRDGNLSWPGWLVT